MGVEVGRHRSPGGLGPLRRAGRRGLASLRSREPETPARNPRALGSGLPDRGPPSTHVPPGVGGSQEGRGDVSF